MLFQVKSIKESNKNTLFRLKRFLFNKSFNGLHVCWKAVSKPRLYIGSKSDKHQYAIFPSSKGYELFYKKYNSEWIDCGVCNDFDEIAETLRLEQLDMMAAS